MVATANNNNNNNNNSSSSSNGNNNNNNNNNNSNSSSKINNKNYYICRWKGENVSTQEVEAVISNVLGLADATVYGVTVPNSDGRAGMVAIANENHDDLDEMLNKLWSGVKEKLPVYARPVFVRIVGKVELTG